MRIHVVRGSADANSRLLLERNFKLRHQIFVEQQGWEALRRPDGRDIDAYDTDLATHLLVTLDDELVGGSRFNSLATPNLLTGVFSHLVQQTLPGDLQDGVDWTRFYVRPDRRERRRRAPESAALFCAMMEYALAAGFSYVTFVSSIYMLEHGTAVGWRITPLGMPVLIDGKPTIAAWIEVSKAALDNVRHATGNSRSFLAEQAPPEPLYAVQAARGRVGYSS